MFHKKSLNWLHCDNSVFVQAGYPNLYTVLGTSTQLPDFRGPMRMGVGQSIENGTTEIAGGGSPHNNLPPLHTVNYIIKAKYVLITLGILVRWAE